MPNIRADALAHQGKSDEALKLLDQIDMERASEKIRKGTLSARARSYCDLGEPKTGLSQVSNAVQNAAADLGLRALQIELTRQALGEEAASKVLDTALEHVASDTSLVARMELALEAEQLHRHGDIIALLDGYVATDRQSDGLLTLIVATISPATGERHSDR